MVSMAESMPQPILCNAPYQQERASLARFKAFGGERPFDFARNPWNLRFARIAHRMNEYRPETAPPLEFAWKLLDEVTAGTWQLVADARSQTIYFRSQACNDIKYIRLADCDFSTHSPIQFIDLHINFKGDVASQLAAWTPEINQAYVLSGFPAGYEEGAFYRSQDWRNLQKNLLKHAEQLQCQIKSPRAAPTALLGPACGFAAEIKKPDLDVTYIANEGFMIRAAGKKVLIDALIDFNPPVIARLGQPPEILKAITEAREPFNELDLILVTHQHPDHFHPASLIACLRSNPKCRLVAHTQAVDLMRSIDGFAKIESQIHEIKLDPGTREQVSHNRITFDVLCLKHMAEDPEKEQVRNLAFFVEMGGTRFLHLGDALIDQSEARLKGYPFERAPIDILFLNQYDRSAKTRALIAERIKPSYIVAMHVTPPELAEESPKIRAAYPHAIIFKQSMERLSLPMEVDFHNISGVYLGQPLPGATPQVFARGIVSTDDNEHSAPSFSLDGNEVFWTANRPPGPDNKEWFAYSMTMRRENGRWSAPCVTPFDGMPRFSPDGRRIYFHSREDIWVAEKQGDHWSEPRCLGINSRFPELKAIYMPSVTRTGTLYFIGRAPGGLRNDMGIYRSELVNGEYAKPQLLPQSVNQPPYLNWAPFIAPDESYLLFSSNRRDPKHDAGDIYVSHRLANSGWTDPVSLGESVNTPRQEVFPGLSPDGKYLFFCRETPGNGNDVYWVNAASIPALRSTPTSLPEKSK